MGRRIIAVLIAMGLVMTTLTGCVKVVKIGEEGNLTGEVEFSASLSTKVCKFFISPCF